MVNKLYLNLKKENGLWKRRPSVIPGRVYQEVGIAMRDDFTSTQRQGSHPQFLRDYL